MSSPRRWPILFALVALLVPALSSAADKARAGKRPNILFAIADDWSFGHAGA